MALAESLQAYIPHSTKRLVLQPWIQKSMWLSKIKLNHLPPHLPRKGSAFSLDYVISISKSWPLADAAIKYEQATSQMTVINNKTQ